MARKVVSIEDLLSHQLVELATEGPDLACPLVAGAFVENALGFLLMKIMLPIPEKKFTEHPSYKVLNDPNGILSTASGRADMCYCLGLIDETTHKNAKNIAKIRNIFAHSPAPVDFTNEDINKICSQLVPPPLVNKDDVSISQEVADKLLTNPRQKFITATLGVFMSIYVASLYTKNKEPINHRVRCPISEDGSSVVGAVVFFNE